MKGNVIQSEQNVLKTHTYTLGIITNQKILYDKIIEEIDQLKDETFLKKYNINLEVVYYDFGNLLHPSDVVDLSNKFNGIIFHNIPSHIGIELFSMIQLSKKSLDVFSYYDGKIYYHKKG